MRIEVEVDSETAAQLDKIAKIVAPPGAAPRRTAALRAVIAIGLQVVTEHPERLTPKKKAPQRG